MLFRLLVILFMCCSCASNEYFEMRREDVKEFVLVGKPLVTPTVKVSTSGFLKSVDYLKRINRDVNISCFQDGNKNIINYLEYTTDSTREYIRHMFFIKSTIYDFKVDEQDTNGTLNTKVHKFARSNYTVITQSCLLIDSDGVAHPIMTDKIVY